jgi:shikimate dehydrogenase
MDRGVKKLYLLGHPVSHSLSPLMQNAALASLGLGDQWHYQTLDVAPEDLVATLERLEADPDVIGCNVTVPHKVAVFEWLGPDRCTDHARPFGAVNTLFRGRDDKFRGDSTDFLGSLEALFQEAFPNPLPPRVLLSYDVAILGTGGSAQTLAVGLASSGHFPRSITIFGRNIEKAARLAATLPIQYPRVDLAEQPDVSPPEHSARLLSDFAPWNQGRRSIVIQTTTVGMDSGEAPGQSPVPTSSIGAGQIAFDLVYKPHETPFLLDAKANGANIVHGINMLVGQGALALERWIHASAPSLLAGFDRESIMAVMRKALRA